MKDFAGKVAFITGGASGAGLGQAQLFGQAGMKVCIADIRQDHLDAAVENLTSMGITAHAIKLDVTDRAGFAAAADECERVFGTPPQLLILTAGVNTFGPAECSTYDDFDWVMGVNLGGTINGLVTFVPRMIKAGLGGHIAMTASWGGFEGGSITAPYAAAKAAVINLGDSYYQALKPYGIGVTVLAPENIKSNIFDANKTRPESMSATGYNVDEKTIEFLRNFHARGMEPIELARWLKEGIENEQVVVVPYADGEEKLREVYSKWINYASPEGMARLAELEKKAEEGKDADRTVVQDDAFVKSGWGKANPNIDWVDSSKKKV